MSVSPEQAERDNTGQTRDLAYERTANPNRIATTQEYIDRLRGVSGYTAEGATKYVEKAFRVKPGNLNGYARSAIGLGTGFLTAPFSTAGSVAKGLTNVKGAIKHAPEGIADIVESVNMLEPGISGSERLERLLNAYFLAEGAGKAKVKTAEFLKSDPIGKHQGLRSAGVTSDGRVFAEPVDPELRDRTIPQRPPISGQGKIELLDAIERERNNGELFKNDVDYRAFKRLITTLPEEALESLNFVFEDSSKPIMGTFDQGSYNHHTNTMRISREFWQHNILDTMFHEMGHHLSNFLTAEERNIVESHFNKMRLRDFPNRDAYRYEHPSEWFAAKFADMAAEKFRDPILFAKKYGDLPVKYGKVGELLLKYATKLHDHMISLRDSWRNSRYGGASRVVNNLINTDRDGRQIAMNSNRKAQGYSYRAMPEPERNYGYSMMKDRERQTISNRQNRLKSRYK